MSRLFAALVLLLLTGCAERAHKSMVLDDKGLQVTARSGVLRCPYRLKSVEDARSDGDRAGFYGSYKLELKDAVGLVTGYLRQAGLGAADAPTGRDVTVRLMHLYMGQNQETKIPVAVFEVRIEAGAPVVVRSQKASMNWWGTQNEGTTAFSAAIQDATAQVKSMLDRTCS